MKLQLTIEMDNAAFEGNFAPEVSRILTKVIRKVEAAGENFQGCPIMDINGNKVGSVEVTD